MKIRTAVLTLFIGFLLFSFLRIACAFQTTVWLSSNTATADTTQNLCMETNPGSSGGSGSAGSIRCVFHGTCINTSAPGSLTIFNSSGTSNNIIATVSTSSAVPCNFYDVAVSSGLTYTKTGNADVTILYQRY